MLYAPNLSHVPSGAIISIAVLVLTTARAPAQNRLYIEPQEVFVGQSGVTIPVLLDHVVSLYGFQLSLVTDPTRLTLRDVDLAGSVAEGAEWSDGRVLEGGARITWGVVLDVSPPFDTNRRIPPGNHQILASLTVDVTAAVESSVSVDFEDRREFPPAKNKLVRERGESVDFTSEDGVVTIRLPTPFEFLRADSDGNGNIELSDGVFTLNYLLMGGSEPECIDAADANDSGAIDLSDAIYTFNFLFRAGTPPPEPFPRKGLDPTEDSLVCLNDA